jgi:type IV pilus assembly protein PilB
VSNPEVNILTAEDPIEFNFDGINQVQVKPDIGLTFAFSLRSFLRQDPDIVMVGEIRDEDTAEIAIRAALTGHLVFSTLHTNDAPSTLNRLLDMNIPNYLVASAVRLIMAQRIVRKICNHCREEVSVDPETWEMLGIDEEQRMDFKIYRGKGCQECNNTGYSGRIGIFEVMPVTRDVERMILSKASSQDLKDQAKDEGMLTLRDAAIEKLKKGITSVEEVLAATTL